MSGMFEKTFRAPNVLSSIDLSCLYILIRKKRKSRAELNLVVISRPITMRSRKSSIVSPLVPALMLILVLGPASDAAISCSDVIKALRPCVNYLLSGSGKPPASCCAGAKSLASAASTPADMKSACECITSAAKQFNPNNQLAQALPANCGINLSFSVSPNTDCSK